ncbi:hypothetical protein AB0D12_39960 [Streptomyces sp. NPDC048479]|uniref:hypothetical protein n=1 Tax=Streptomyces sp. NPDC048479 TaxID=3154725 RepID=UPI003433F233
MTAAAGSMMWSTPAQGYESITVYDRSILDGWQPGEVRGYGIGDKIPTPISGRTLSDYCERVGFGNAERQCYLIDFYEEKRLDYTPNYVRPASKDAYFNCTPETGTDTIGWQYQKTATNAVGASISLAYTINFKSAPFGIGAESSLTTTVGANYTYTWGTATTESGTKAMPVPTGYVGWWDYATYHGTAQGVATVYINSFEPGAPVGYFKVVAQIKGDLPEPADPTARAAQPVQGLVAQARPMTDGEKQVCASNPTMQRRPAPAS